MSNLDDLISDLERVLAAVENDCMEEALKELDTVMMRLEQLSAPRAKTAKRVEKRANRNVVPLRQRPAPRPAVQRRRAMA